MSGPARGRLQGIPGTVGRPRVQAHAATVALPQPRGAAVPLGPRILDALVRLPDSRWLDRLLRGRAWIALIAIGLIGLVFMQVSMLGMNAGIGQAVERADVLGRQNADLRREVSALSSEERIQREAIANGLVMPPAGDVRYLRSNGMAQDAAKAAKTMRAPSEQAKATVAAAAAGATAVGTPLAGDTAAQPGATTDPATGAATAPTGTAATGSTSGATGSTSGAATTTGAGAATGAAAGTAGTAGTTGTAAGTTGTAAGTTAAPQQQAPAAGTAGTATGAAAGAGSTSGATGSTSGATAAGAAAAPGTGQ